MKAPAQAAQLNLSVHPPSFLRSPLYTPCSSAYRFLHYENHTGTVEAYIQNLRERRGELWPSVRTWCDMLRGKGRQRLRSADYSLYGGAEAVKPPPTTTTKSKAKKSIPVQHSNEGRAPRRVFSAKEGESPDLWAHSVPPKDPKDFLWLMTEEPHRSRRMAILKAHPEVRAAPYHASNDTDVVNSRSQSSWATNLSRNGSFWVSFLFRYSWPSTSGIPPRSLHGGSSLPTRLGERRTITSSSLSTRSRITSRSSGLYPTSCSPSSRICRLGYRTPRHSR